MPKSGTDFYWGFVLIDPEALLEFSWRVLRSQLGPECLPWEPKGHLQLLLFLQVTCSGRCSWDTCPGTVCLFVASVLILVLSLLPRLPLGFDFCVDSLSDVSAAPWFFTAKAAVGGRAP